VIILGSRALSESQQSDTPSIVSRAAFPRAREAPGQNLARRAAGRSQARGTTRRHGESVRQHAAALVSASSPSYVRKAKRAKGDMRDAKLGDDPPILPAGTESTTS
jgi:hypothetical protein